MKQETKLWIQLISSFACMCSIVLIVESWLLQFNTYSSMCIATELGMIIGLTITSVAYAGGKLIAKYYIRYYEYIRNKIKNENTT